MNIDVYFVSSTKGIFRKTTRVAYSKSPTDDFRTLRFDGTEMRSLPEFALKVIRRGPGGAQITFHCRPNKLRSAFEKGWIEDWVRDGFRKKPRKHRQIWAELYHFLEEKNVNFKFADISDLEAAPLTVAAQGKWTISGSTTKLEEYLWDAPSLESNDAINRKQKRYRKKKGEPRG